MTEAPAPRDPLGTSRTGSKAWAGRIREPWALIAGWLAGLVTGTAMVASTGFQSATYPLALDGLVVPGYAALYSLIANFAVAIALSAVLNRVATTRGSDETTPGDYHFEPPPAAETPAPISATA